MGSCCRGTRTADTIREDPHWRRENSDRRTNQSQSESTRNRGGTEGSETENSRSENAQNPGRGRDDRSEITGISVRTGMLIGPPRAYADINGLDRVPPAEEPVEASQVKQRLPPRKRKPKDASEFSEYQTYTKTNQNGGMTDSRKQESEAAASSYQQPKERMETKQKNSHINREASQVISDYKGYNKSSAYRSGLKSPGSRSKGTSADSEEERDEGAIDEPDQSSTEVLWSQLKNYLPNDKVEISAFGQTVFPMMDNESYYMTVFYSLGHMTPLALYFTNQLFLREINMLYHDNNDGPCATMGQFFSYLWAVQTSGETVDPPKFRSRVEGILPEFCNGYKRDAAEFFYLFMEKLEEVIFI